MRTKFSHSWSVQMLPCLWIENIFNYPCFKCLTDAVAHSTNTWVPTLCQALYSMTGKRQEISSLVREKWVVRAEGLQCAMPSRQKIFCCCLVTKSCLTLCDLMARSLPSSTVPGISWARILHWVPLLTPGDLPNPGIESTSPAMAGKFFTTEPPGKPQTFLT